MARAVGGGGKFEIVYGFLSSMELGEVRVENVPVYIRHFFDDRVPVDGYLGLSVIRGSWRPWITANVLSHWCGQSNRAISDLLQKTVGNLQPPVTDVVEIPLRTTSSGFLSGEVWLEGIEKPQNFIIDTGASISVVSEKLAALEELAELYDSYSNAGFRRGRR